MVDTGTTGVRRGGATVRHRWSERLAAALCATTIGLGAADTAHAGMGHTEAVIGLDVKAEKGTVDLVCGLGAACEIDGVYHRSLRVGKINRGETVTFEPNVTYSGIGFGSILSSQHVPHIDGDKFTDIFCWSGKRTGRNPGNKLSLDVRECVEIFDKNQVDPQASSSSCPSVIAVMPQTDGCADVASQFTPVPDADYAVIIDETNYGGPIDVLTCRANVVAQCVTDTRQSDVNLLANEGMGGADPSWYGMLGCC